MNFLRKKNKIKEWEAFLRPHKELHTILSPYSTDTSASKTHLPKLPVKPRCFCTPMFANSSFWIPGKSNWILKQCHGPLKRTPRALSPDVSLGAGCSADRHMGPAVLPGRRRAAEARGRWGTPLPLHKRHFACAKGAGLTWNTFRYSGSTEANLPTV